MKKKLISLEKFAEMQLEVGDKSYVRGGAAVESSGPRKSWEQYHTVEGDGSSYDDHAIDARVVDYCISY